MRRPLRLTGDRAKWQDRPTPEGAMSDSKREDDLPEREARADADPDREAILARKKRLIAIAIGGLTTVMTAAGCDGGPTACLSPRLEDGGVDGGPDGGPLDGGSGDDAGGADDGGATDAG
jgi:hypothetical protein